MVGLGLILVFTLDSFNRVKQFIYKGNCGVGESLQMNSEATIKVK